MALPAFLAAILIVAAVAFVFFAAAQFDPAQAMSGMFGYRETGWPTGVQEDDDATWSWSRRAAQPVADDPDPDVELVDGLPPIEAERLRYAVRSADRARS